MELRKKTQIQIIRITAAIQERHGVSAADPTAPQPFLKWDALFTSYVVHLSRIAACPLPFEISKRFCGLPSFLLFIRRFTVSPSSFSFDHHERRSREKFELLLRVALYLICDDGILVVSKNTSAVAVDVTGCQCLLWQWVHWVSFVRSRSSHASTLPCSLMTLLARSLMSVNHLPPSGNNSCTNSSFFEFSVFRINTMNSSRLSCIVDIRLFLFHQRGFSLC